MSWFDKLFSKKATNLPTIAPNRFLFPVTGAVGNTIYPEWGNNHVLTFVSSHDVYSVVSRIAQAVAMLPVYTYKKTNDKAFKRFHYKHNADPLRRIYRSKALEQLSEEDELSLLLKTPNSYQTGAEFIELISIFDRICGECFIYKYSTLAGKVLSLHIFAPADTALIVNTGEFPVKVIGYNFNYQGKEVLKNVPPEDVIHIKCANPTYDQQGTHLRGLSPLKSGKSVVDGLELGQKRGNAVMKNGGVPGIIALDGELDVPEYEKWKGSFQKWINNDDNAGAPMPMAGKATYFATGLSMADLKLMDVQAQNFKKLCNLYKVSHRIFDTDGAGSENSINEMVRQFYTSAVMPLADRIKDALNKGLAKDGKYIDFDYSEIRELQADMQKTMQAISAMPITLTGNEIRELMQFEESDEPDMNVPLIKQGYSLITDRDILPAPDAGLEDTPK